MADVLSKNLSKIKVPLGEEKIYKDECIFSFDNPETETGLFVCLNSFIGLGRRFIERYYKKTGNNVFLCLKRKKIEVPQEEDASPEKAPTKLAIGVEGGFCVDKQKFEYVDQNSIVVLPEWTEIPLPNADIPDLAQLSVSTVLVAEDLWKQEQAAALAGTWDGEKRIVSKYAATLMQLDNGKKIPPRGWKCEKCDLTTNLWLNLTDGSILCGRKFFDGTGGNNHAVDYYQEKRYPLAVKLGTITPDGADVFSYDEDDMVEDPYLAKHLAHFGINITSLEKTDKTMIELEIDINQKIGEWDVIQEAGSTLTPVYGAGYTGMRNLGNSCYMNSLMQVIFTIPDFHEKYFTRYNDTIENTTTDPNSDFNLQMSKLAHGLISGEYSKSPPENISEHLMSPNGICPRMFKLLVGRGHPEFSTNRQQDVQEFFLHIMNMIERNSRGSANPTECFKYQVEERVQCMQSNKVKYTNRVDYLLALPVPMEAAINKDEVAAYEKKKSDLESQGLKIDPKELTRPKISLTSCIECFAADEMVDDFYSSAIQCKSVAKKTTRLSTFPDYLFIQLKKFTIGSDWLPKKLDVAVDIPDELDISHLRGKGLQPGEEVLPEEQQSYEPEINLDEAVVGQLIEMGFPIEACKKGVFYTNNSGIESAMNWVMEHLDDPDIASPLQVSKSSGSDFIPNDDALSMIMAMGFTKDQATKALKETNNNIERAADWIFSHQNELDTPMETEQATASTSQDFRDGCGKYKLVAFISHMGTSTMVGHYVCHILKEGRWVIYNDEKVALSEKPPKDLAYLYLYQRQKHL